VSNRIFELLSQAIPPSGEPYWTETVPLSPQSLHDLIHKMRTGVLELHACGTADRPHVFHPADFPRLLPKIEWPPDILDVKGWTACGNCGMPWPLRPEQCGATDGNGRVRCTLPVGHSDKPWAWHEEIRDGQLWAEWRGPMPDVVCYICGRSGREH
jgi:hypothetical protein